MNLAKIIPSGEGKSQTMYSSLTRGVFQEKRLSPDEHTPDQSLNEIRSVPSQEGISIP